MTKQFIFQGTDSFGSEILVGIVAYRDSTMCDDGIEIVLPADGPRLLTIAKSDILEFEKTLDKANEWLQS